MALDRFSNIKEIQETNGVVRGIVWNESDLDILQLDVKNITPKDRPIVEIHLYTIGSESTYITGGCINDFEVVVDKLHINYGKACQSLGIERGQFEVVINVYRDLLGTKEEPNLYIKEISDDRLEVHVQALSDADLDIKQYLDDFGSGTHATKIYETTIDGDGNEVNVVDENGSPKVLSVEEHPISADIAINFGDNKLSKIINQKDWDAENDFVVRLYKPLDELIEVKSNLWIIEQLSDSYIDNIDLSGPGAKDAETRTLLGPNFNIDTKGGTVTETDFQSWNELLDTNLSTSQQIIDKIFSGSIGSNLHIDYSGMQNFVHFSSAKERVDNFKYKLGLVEYYDGRIVTLNTATTTTDTSLQGNINTNQQRRDSVIGSFDGFERWLYNDQTSSLFTDHTQYDDDNNSEGIYGAEGGFLGAKKYRLESWPKYLSGSKYVLHTIDSTIGTNWYNGWISSASFYDSENNNSLARSIPEHIRSDENNSEYELFVNMIGHHFDILYSHIDNLTKVYKPEEHPKLGQSKDTLYQVAKSLGWTLENGNQAEALWKYKLGVTSSGSAGVGGAGEYATTGKMFSKSNEAITTEVWRRIVNNLPYLLKTKGTTRSIKALMNTYGIPQTLLSIREYGGPQVDADSPVLIEDRFSYALNFNSASAGVSRIQIARDWHSSSFSDWGIEGVKNPSLSASPTAITASIEERPADTIEFRFKPAIKQTMMLLSHEKTATPANVYWNLGIEHTGSYSGSSDYGRLFLNMKLYGGGAATATVNSFSDWTPLYDGDIWNTRIWTAFPFVTASLGNVPTIYFQAQKASDYISGKIIHRASGSLFPGSGSTSANASNILRGWARDDGSRQLVLGGHTGSSITTPYTKQCFSGSIQEYREWMEILDQETFDHHTLNPTSYVSSLSPTASYDTILRHYPFGTELNAIDHSTGAGLNITSSHPNQTIKDFSPPFPNGHDTYATAAGFTSPTNPQRGNYSPIEETYYIQGVSLGGNVPRSQKIRLESNELVRRLSPTSTAEKSRFDRASVDTNKLGLFYSPADQINKDIFNHIGNVSLDDYIGDPDHEITPEYPDLTHFSKEYWKKYSDKNDINAFLRIFSQFDFTLFSQIKQLLPERIDEAMGLLVEPHALERSKVVLSKRPEKEALHYNTFIPIINTSQSGHITPLSASVYSSPLINGSNSIYHKGTGGYADTGNYKASFSGSTTGDPFEATVYKYEYTLFPYRNNPIEAAALSLPRQITGSLHPLTTSPTGSVLLTERPSRVFSLVTFHYGTGSATTRRGKDAQKNLSRSLGMTFSSSLSPASYRDDFFQMTENQRYEGCKLTGPGINVSSIIAALDNKPVIEVFETNPNTLIFNNQPSALNPGNLDVR